MASPSTVLTEGLGSWGSASELVTLGLGIGEAVTTTVPYSVDYTATDGLPHYAAMDGLPHYVVLDGMPHYRAEGKSSESYVSRTEIAILAEDDTPILDEDGTSFLIFE